MASLRTVRWRLLAIMLYFFGFGVVVEKALAQQAQQAPQPTIEEQLQAVSSQVFDELNQIIQWRIRADRDEKRIAELETELAKLKKAVDPPKR